MVELAPLRDQGAVPAAVGDALDVQQRANRTLTDSIVEMLASRHLLLVLDNCEHVLDTTSELVEQILRWCPNVRVLATSREPLGIPAEVVWSVPPLPVPADRDDPVAALAENPAVQLFVDRACAARHDFELDRGNAAAVAEICIRLDGVPLALELAAARMRSMSAAQLAERLPERFRVLAGSRRATDPRHRNLRDLVQWSYELLTDDEQRVFERLSIFAGSFDLERAEHVCAGHGIDEVDISGLLVALVDKSMVTAERTQGPTRYRQLETLREFGREQLAERPEHGEIRAAHGHVHVELAERADTGLGGPDEARWVRELDTSFDDMREAHGSAIGDGDVDRAIRLVVALREYAWRLIRYELLAWADATLRLEGADEHPLYPVALGVVAYGHFVRGDLAAAVDVGERAIAAADRLGTTTAGLAERAFGQCAVLSGPRGRRPRVGRRHDQPGHRARLAEHGRACVLHAVGGRDVGRERRVGAPRSRELAAAAAATIRESRPRSPRPSTRREWPSNATDSRAGLAAARSQRATRGVGWQPLDPCVRAHRELVDPRPLRRAP